MAAQDDDAPAEFSELDLSEDDAITGEEVADAFKHEEGSSIVRADPEADAATPDEE